MSLKNNMKILINAFGIQDSGGITVLDKLFRELECSSNNDEHIIICHKNKNILKLIKIYEKYENLTFEVIINKGLIHRFYLENIFFRRLIKERNIDLVYNFSGSAQFFSKIPQITKVHNLLFYSLKLDKIYFEKKEYLKWLKQIFIKRVLFIMMLKQTKYIEIQSSHVKEYISDFLNIQNKFFYIKSDISLEKNDFTYVKKYNFLCKIKFLYIIGPHFEYIHKNFEDFVKIMLKFKEEKNFDFEIDITLTTKQLHSSRIWDKSLDKHTNFLGYINKNEIVKKFQDNSILISTSVIETLGLHVIEALQNGILTIVPNELYSNSVYGNNILTYELFDINNMIEKIKQIYLLNDNNIKDIILNNQQYLINNENTKYETVIDIFNEILKDNNV